MSGAESRMQVVWLIWGWGSHPHHPVPIKPVPSPQVLLQARLCHVAGTSPGSPGPDPATLQPHGAGKAGGFVLPARMPCLSLPSLGLTHFFLPLLA